MLSKNTIKLIKSLAFKKHRQKTGLFITEGNKFVREIINSSFTIDTLIGTTEFINKLETRKDLDLIHATQEDINRASLLKNPQQAIALVHIPREANEINIENNLILCLDGVQDPGNLGNIVRTADWFGIRQIFCSADTVDIYNPKALQSTMGAVTRVRVNYLELDQFFIKAKSLNIKIFGTSPDGKNIYGELLPKEAVIVIGNEGKGIKQKYSKFLSENLSIPNFSGEVIKSESLNASVAAAVICSEFRRQACYS